MKFLLDQGLPRTTAPLLRAAGWDVVHTGEVGLAEAGDPVILERARAEGRVVVTLDADFHALLAHSRAVQPSVIRIRIEGLRSESVADLLRDVARRCPSELEAGCVISVQAQRLRIHRLPLPAPRNAS